MYCKVFLTRIYHQRKYAQCSPNRHNSEVETVPSIPEIGARMKQESVSYNLHHALAGEDGHENPFHLFLMKPKESIMYDRLSLMIFEVSMY